jgi:hypothetical protein
VDDGELRYAALALFDLSGDPAVLLCGRLLVVERPPVWESRRHGSASSTMPSTQSCERSGEW